MAQFVQLVVNGLTLGSLYALIALGYSLVYGVLKLLNFAHGEVYMIGSFIGYGVLQVLGGSANPSVPVGILLPLLMLVAALGAGLVGVAIERFAYRPLRQSPRIAPLVSALGTSFFLQATMLLVVGARIVRYESEKLIDVSSGVHAGVLNISVMRMLVIGVSAVVMIGLSIFMRRSKLGKAMRATSYDPEAAQMMGMDVNRVVMVTFFIGSALAGVAGVMSGLVYNRVFHTMGFVAGLKGFTASVVGGIGSIQGAMAGGLIIGFAESFAQGYVSTTFYDVVVFVVLIGFLLTRPRGLFGVPELKKV
jgi:branched-chain amino acid transport system permease protein